MAWERLAGLVQEERFADVLDLGYCALQVERLGEHYLEDLEEDERKKRTALESDQSGIPGLRERRFRYLLDVDAMAGAAEY